MPTHAKSRAAAPRPGDLLRTERIHRLRTVEQLLSVVTGFARDQGLSRAECRRICEKALAARAHTTPAARSAPGVRFATLMRIADLLEVWYRDPQYLDGAGRPKPLSPDGAGGFAPLCRRFLPEYEPAEVLSVLIAERLLERRARGAVAPRRRTAAFATLNPMLLERLPVLVKGLVDTLAHNTDARARRSGTRCDRSTHLASLPVSQLPAFHAHVKRLAQVLLDRTDAWAKPRLHTGAAQRSPATAHVGVEVFSFVQDGTSGPVPKRPRASR